MDENNEFTEEKIFEIIKKEDVKFIKLQFTDILGTTKSVMIPVEQFPDSIERGTWFDGSSIEGFVRIYESDMYLKPDLSTFAIIPWRPKEKKVARVICDVHDPSGKPFLGDPRYILKRILKKAKDEFNFIFNTGPEIEFFLFNREQNGGGNGGKVSPVPHDVGSYFDFSPLDLASDVRRNIIFALEEMGITTEMSHHEVAPGQHEIDITYDEALKMADKAVAFKYTVKAIASTYGLYASFMPKPAFGINGSGMHVHQSLFNLEGKNIFFDDSDKYKLSKTAHSFISGQLEHIKAMSAILSPTVNSYKRLVPGYEAPVYICWGQINRSALIRIPRYSSGKEQSTRAELRSPDPSCNPYLSFAVMLAAGLDGIKRNLEPRNPVEEDVYHFDDRKLKKLKIDTLPTSMETAFKYLEKDELLKETLGDHICKFFFRAKKEEWKSYKVQVTPWEFDRYFEYL